MTMMAMMMPMLMPASVTSSGLGPEGTSMCVSHDCRIDSRPSTKPEPEASSPPGDTRLRTLSLRHCHTSQAGLLMAVKFTAPDLPTIQNKNAGKCTVEKIYHGKATVSSFMKLKSTYMSFYFIDKCCLLIQQLI